MRKQTKNTNISITIEFLGSYPILVGFKETFLLLNVIQMKKNSSKISFLDIFRFVNFNQFHLE